MMIFWEIMVIMKDFGLRVRHPHDVKSCEITLSWTP